MLIYLDNNSIQRLADDPPTLEIADALYRERQLELAVSRVNIDEILAAAIRTSPSLPRRLLRIVAGLTRRPFVKEPADYLDEIGAYVQGKQANRPQPFYSGRGPTYRAEECLRWTNSLDDIDLLHAAHEVHQDQTAAKKTMASWRSMIGEALRDARHHEPRAPFRAWRESLPRSSYINMYSAARPLQNVDQWEMLHKLKDPSVEALVDSLLYTVWNKIRKNGASTRIGRHDLQQALCLPHVDHFASNDKAFGRMLATISPRPNVAIAYEQVREVLLRVSANR